MSTAHRVVNHSILRCPYCHDVVTIQSSKKACEQCMAWHHKECWNETGRCSTCQFGDSHSPSNPPSRMVLQTKASVRSFEAEGQRKICHTAGCNHPALNTQRAHKYSNLCSTHGLALWESESAKQMGSSILLWIATLGAFFSGALASRDHELYLLIGALLFASAAIVTVASTLNRRPM